MNPEQKQFPIKRLLAWYHKNKRDMPWRRTSDVYCIWISEVMLQQTQVVTGIPYYKRFLERFPTINALAEAGEQDVLKLWEGLGYYSRARNLHKAAGIVVSDYKGIIPTDMESFSKLPGVGPYISAAVLSIATQAPLPAVDANVLRVYARYDGIEDDIRKTAVRNLVFKQLKEVIPPEAPGDFNQAVMELGALVCTPKNPECATCPFKKACTAMADGSVSRLPYKSPKPGVPTYKVSVAIIMEKGLFYIQKRPSTGHLGGLWEFPGGKSEENESPQQTLHRECREELGNDVEIVSSLKVVRHAYSHFKIEMTPFICRLEDGNIQSRQGLESRWISFAQLDNYPFPGANHKIFPRLKEHLALQG
ncbi:MAG: A/G-specific adenine glycosylase [bacterium]|nr:A/G-specific adenine glycosylase [bacterium]